MTSRLGLRLLALAVPALLLAPASAHAASLTVDDGVGDARALNMAVALGGLVGPMTGQGPLFLGAPEETSVDVVRTTIDHAQKRLTLTVQFRDLVEVDGHSVEFRIFTPEERYVLSVGTLDGQTVSGVYHLGRGDGVTVSSDGNTVTVTETASKPCRTVRARYDLAADTLVASVPTSCLGSPKWVQVAAGVTRTKLIAQADGSANISGYVDDAFRAHVSMNSLGRSPKVRRG